VLELAMAVVLLAGAGLMVRTLSALLHVDTGFQAENLLFFGVSMPPSVSSAPPEAIRSGFRELESRFGGVNGVDAVSVSWGAIPMNGDDEELFWMDGQPKPTSAGDMNWALRYIVGPDYLRVMRTRLLRGRFFNARDDNHSPLVVVIDEQFARQYFGAADAIGKRIHLDVGLPGADAAEIIGIVEHVKQWGLDTDDKQQLRAEMYMPMLQLPDSTMPQIPSGFAVLARFRGSQQAVFDGLRRASSAMNDQQTIYGAESMSATIARTISARRFSMLLLASFAGLALILAMLGVYGVVSYSVGRRTNEIGIRMALGARRGEVFRLVLGEGMRLAGIGALLGIAAALALTRLLSNLLFGVSAHDPATFAVMAFALLAVAAIAVWIPARRAMNVDPMIALRHE